MREELKNPWEDEEDYRAYLTMEREVYAWCLVKYGHYSRSEALKESESFYEYEPPGEYRGLVFHDEAWHWAMLKVFGESYWELRPDLESPSAEYEKQWKVVSKGSLDRQ